MVDRDEFVDALLVAPVGATWLAMLETRARDDLSWWEVPADTDAGAVARAADDVQAVGTTLGSLLAVALDAAVTRVGPWIGDAPDNLARAHRHAEARRPIAEAIADRFGVELHAPLDPAAQQWWCCGSSDEEWLTHRRFGVEDAYGAGQFTWAGVWTVTDPPSEVHGELIAAWELEFGPVSRWALPSRPDARVVEIHRPGDWVRLVTTYPTVGRSHPEWELPGVNQHPRELGALLTVEGQHGARRSIRHHLVPDWRAVAAEHDGVHLSWAGFLTTEGYVSDLGDGDVALLRYWFSERTHWLREVFDDPTPLPPPVGAGT